MNLAFDMIKPDANDTVGYKLNQTSLNTIKPSENDTPLNIKVNEDNMVNIPRNDKIEKHGDVNTVRINNNDHIKRHSNKKTKLVTKSRNDTPENLGELSTTQFRPEPSIMDFARMFVSERKSDDDNRMKFNPVNEKRPNDDKLISHDTSMANIVDRPTDPQTVNIHKMDNGHIVNVHQNDHNEII